MRISGQELQFEDLGDQAVLPDPSFSAFQDVVVIEGAHRLLLAVLEDAIRTFQRYALASDPRGRALFREAEAWLMGSDSGAALSVDFISEAIGFDAEFVRSRLRRWRERCLADTRPTVEVVITEPERGRAGLRKASGE